MKKYNVIDFGAVADGKTLCTQSVQKAIDACSVTGGTVWFPKGEYVLSTVFLKSNVNIHICRGAVILGTLDFYEYCPDEKVDFTLYQDASHSFFHCSMFVGEHLENVSFTGNGKIDMRSVWDEDNVRGLVHRAAKSIALLDCKNVLIENIGVYNSTDLAIYFTACEDVIIRGVSMRVYIDGISPDNSKNVLIENCFVESGDDGIVFKSSFNQNKFDECRNIVVRNCRIKSRCNAIKFGTETNGGFYDFLIENVEVFQSRITGISIESVDGAIIENVVMRNIHMRNVGTPLFIHLSDRMRGPAGSKIGAIRNITLENITAKGPYLPYKAIAWNYVTYKAGDEVQNPWWAKDSYTKNDAWQITSNVCGREGYCLENITLKDINFELVGGELGEVPPVTENPPPYPEVNVYGLRLPASGIYFRHIRGLNLENVQIKLARKDVRPVFVYEDVQ